MDGSKGAEAAKDITQRGGAGTRPTVGQPCDARQEAKGGGEPQATMGEVLTPNNNPSNATDTYVIALAKPPPNPIDALASPPNSALAFPPNAGFMKELILVRASTNGMSGREVREIVAIGHAAWPSTQVIGYSCPSSHNIFLELIDSTVRCPRDFSTTCQGKCRVNDVVGLHPGLTAQHFVKANGITEPVAVEAHRLLLFVDKSRRTSYFVVQPRHNENVSDFGRRVLNITAAQKLLHLKVPFLSCTADEEGYEGGGSPAASRANNRAASHHAAD
jgi:hypothetical protein